MPEPSALTAEQVIRIFPAYQGPAAPGYYIDFLGIRTRATFVSVLHQEGGVVEGYPFPGNFHATTMEWAGALRAVLSAKDQWVAVELGAGWGPWLVATASAAQRRGIQNIQLVGVEASKAHCDFMHTHLADNGIDPSKHTLLHGVAGTHDGTAQFPVLDKPAEDWGAQMATTASAPAGGFFQRLFGAKPAAPAKRTESVKSYSLPTLLQPFRLVDLVHVDIQGHEYEVIASARAVLKEKARWLVVGTHSRVIEQQLLEELSAAGWVLEEEEACMYKQNGTTAYLYRDGCQVWRNPVLVADGGAAT